MTMEIREIQRGLEKVRKWLIDAIVPGGRFEHEGLTYRALFKAPLALASAGMVTEGNRCSDFLKRYFMQPNGDFKDSRFDTHPAPSLKYFYIYRASWIAIGAHRLTRFDISEKSGEFVLSFQDPKKGGFFATHDRNPSYFHLCSTAEGGNVALMLGQWQKAALAGDFIIRMLKAQPEPERYFYLVFSQNEKPVKDWPEEAPDFGALQKGKPKQQTFILAIAMEMLSQLYMVTQKKCYLEGAKELYNILEGIHEDVFTIVHCGKLARASAILYYITKETRYRNGSLLAAKSLYDAIHRKPPFTMRDIYPDPANQPAPLTYEYAFECAYSLNGILQYLGDGRNRDDKKP